MKYSILLVLLLIVSLNASAQMFSGRVLDDQKIPVQYATVALLSVADSSLISGTVTDEQGIFKIEVSESKPYLLAVSYVGYKRSIQRLMPSIIGDIVIIPADRMLDEVVVTQHLPLYRLDNGGLTTKVENTILSKAGTAMNVAELLPGVLKRPDGTLEVLGKGTPLIYINDSRKYTLPLGLASMKGMYSTDWPVLMASSVISVLPVLIAFLFAQDAFVKGVMMTGMKE